LLECAFLFLYVNKAFLNCQRIRQAYKVGYLQHHELI
jgi:hypothetical protein